MAFQKLRANITLPHPASAFENFHSQPQFGLSLHIVSLVILEGDIEVIVATMRFATVASALLGASAVYAADVVDDVKSAASDASASASSVVESATSEVERPTFTVSSRDLKNLKLAIRSSSANSSTCL